MRYMRPFCARAYVISKQKCIFDPAHFRTTLRTEDKKTLLLNDMYICKPSISKQLEQHWNNR